MKKNYMTTTRDKKTVLVHRIIWEEHHGPIPKGKIIHHIDGDVTNNRIENLECISSSEHAKKHWAVHKAKVSAQKSEG